MSSSDEIQGGSRQNATLKLKNWGGGRVEKALSGWGRILARSSCGTADRS